MRRKAARIPVEIDPNDPFAPVERINYSGLSPEEIRDLLAACPDSLDQISSYEDDGDQQREYVCELEDCAKVFPDHSTYRKHQMTHGERMFRCMIEGCGKKFLDNSKLKRH